MSATDADVIESSGSSSAPWVLAVVLVQSGIRGVYYAGLNVLSVLSFESVLVALERWLAWGLVLLVHGMSWILPLMCTFRVGARRSQRLTPC